MGTAIAKRAQRTIAGMTEELRDVYTQIRDKLDQDSFAAVTLRYEIGVMLRDIREDEGKYGDAAMSQLSDALGISENVLWACHKLAMTWSSDEIQELIEQKNAKGGRLTFSHLSMLSGLPDEKLRTKLVKACLSEAFTVEELSSEIRNVLGSKRSSGRRPPLAPHSPMAGLKQFAKLAANLSNRQDVYEASVFQRLDEVTAKDVSSTLIEQLTEAGETAVKLEEFAKASRQRLEVALQRVTRMGELPAADEDDEEEEEDEDADDEDVEIEDEEASKEKRRVAIRKARRRAKASV